MFHVMSFKLGQPFPVASYASLAIPGIRARPIAVMLSDVTVRAATPNAADVAKCCCLSVVNCIESLQAWADVEISRKARIRCFMFLSSIADAALGGVGWVRQPPGQPDQSLRGLPCS